MLHHNIFKFYDLFSVGRCVLLDRNGFVILEQSFIPPKPDCDGILNIHITCQDMNIAYDLINRGVMVSGDCISYVNINKVKFWKVGIGIAEGLATVCSGSIVVTTLDCGPGGSGFSAKPLFLVFTFKRRHPYHVEKSRYIVTFHNFY